MSVTSVACEWIVTLINTISYLNNANARNEEINKCFWSHVIRANRLNRFPYSAKCHCHCYHFGYGVSVGFCSSSFQYNALCSCTQNVFGSFRFVCIYYPSISSNLSIGHMFLGCVGAVCLFAVHLKCFAHRKWIPKSKFERLVRIRTECKTEIGKWKHELRSKDSW